jgi:uncharacterized RDD family membrane protein YckC
MPAARSVGSVWRRCVAYLVDSLILSTVGGGLGKVIFDKLSQLGLWGPLAGFCLALVYFAVFDSEIGDGQTLGKRWLKLRVVGAEGNTIPFAKSLLRSAIFLVPAFLFGLRRPETMPWVISLLISDVVLWVGGSTLYLIIFNRQTRQGLHELATGSYVAHADDSGPVETKAVLTAQWLTLGALLVAGSVGAEIVNAKLDKMPPFPQMRQDAKLIEQMNGFEQAKVGERLVHTATGGGPTKNLIVYVHQKSKVQEASADEVARIILQNDPNAQNYDQLSILFFYGYDIGIAARWNHQEFTRTPAEWRQRVFGSSPVQGPPLAHP